MAERYRKHVYCEKNFLEHCIKTIAEWKFCEQNFEELRLWMCIKSLIFSPDIVLHLDISDDDLPQFNGPKSQKVFSAWAIELAQMQSEQKIHLKLGDFVTPETINKSDNKQLTAYYLTCADCNTCQKCMDECGVLAICPENIKDFKSILYDNGSAIGKNEQIAKDIRWKKYLNINPCNSLILIDNYILQGTHYINNLESIIDSILPKSLNDNVIFQIFIFTELKEFQQITKFYDEINILIRTKRPKLKFDLSLFKCNGCFHDRIIATNNVYISCGSGFDILGFNKEISRFNLISLKMTVLNILFPFFPTDVKWGTMAYQNFEKESFSFTQKCNEYQGKDNVYNFYVGSKQNRLIE